MGRRFGGGLRADSDSRNAHGGKQKLSVIETGKKVLFLHAFRDANSVPIEADSFSKNLLFTNYFEWADFCFRVISEEPNSWLIRQHPSSRFYPGDAEILERLLDRHGLEKSVLMSNAIPTSEIIASRAPVFTHSGTIALETAYSGYRAIVCSTIFPEPLVDRARNTAELEHKMLRPYEEGRKRIDARKLRLAAGALLMERQVPTGTTLTATPPQPSRTSPVSYQISSAKQQVSLVGKLFFPSERSHLREVANKISASSGLCHD